MLRLRADETPDRVAYTYLVDGEKEEISLTYGELARRADAIARDLLRHGARGERAILLYADGLDFVAAFFGCLRAGVVAVPTFPPHPARLERTLPRLVSIVSDSDARYVLTTEAIASFRETVAGQAPELGRMDWIATDRIDACGGHDVDLPHVTRLDLAYLQYTSGSTGSPKGVMVSHGNLLHNEELIRLAFAQSRDSVVVGWLPVFHDMGLIGHLLQPLYVGGRSVLMSPLAFLQKPSRWLDAITRYRGTIAAAPNFAYDLCVRRTTDEERKRFDLSSWSQALNGAEPVRQDTIDRFVGAFAPCGFRVEAVRPCYGLAEATLVVAGTPAGSRPYTLRVSAAGLERNEVVPLSARTAPESSSRLLVASGLVCSGTEVRVIDPATGRECPPGRIGELWVRSGSVAAGYWNRPAETQETFGGRVADTNDGPFLRTGDLGFLDENRLFVTGRLKDMIIVRGRNHYAQDIETTVETSHPSLRPGCGVAFSVDEGVEERLVIVQEVELEKGTIPSGADPRLEEAATAILRAITEGHDLRPHAIVLVAARSVPKTASGKLQRRLCGTQFRDGTLQVVHEWREQAERKRYAESSGSDPQGFESRVVEQWMIEQVAEAIGEDPRFVDPRLPFNAYGLDSARSVEIAGALAEWIGRPLPATILWEYATIRELARALAGEQRQERSPLRRVRDSIRALARAMEEDRVPDTGANVSAALLPRWSDEPIAIVGIGCRFPGANGPEAFWRMLQDGVDAVREQPAPRAELASYAKGFGSAPRPVAGYVDDVDAFDGDFFHITPKEAAAMDPQQRLLLEVAYEALEDGGLPLERLAGSRAGVFVGISSGEYAWLQLASGVDAYFGTGCALSIAANRISYALGLQGPSMAIDTACSSSLVAVHTACQSLRENGCDVALAGGVNLILGTAVTSALEQAGALSPDGRCKTFDARANGYVRGEGAGIVLLKRLSRALDDGDTIYAVVRGAAVNNDGKSNGLMAPSPQAQEAVLREAYRRAGVEPREVCYVEAHGTGTRLGDPIETRVLSRVVGARRAGSAHPVCWLGSVKTNIGHLEPAAGVAGLIKVALSLRHRVIPPSLHFEQPNPLIEFDAWNLRVPTRPVELPANGSPLRAAVSSFGFGGTNAHVVLEEAPPAGATHTESRSSISGPLVIPLSARNPTALRALAGSWRAFAERATVDFHDACFTAGLHRTHHEHRLAIVAESWPEFRERVQAYLSGALGPGIAATDQPLAQRHKTTFMFSGQGSQWPRMGWDLAASDDVVREALEECDAAIRRIAGWSLLEELERDEKTSRLARVDIVQPSIFALQVALARRWRAWGIEPDAVIGHSMGEVAAAHVAGMLSLEDAARVICERSRVVREAAGPGAMALVELPLAEAQKEIEAFADVVSVAAENSPHAVIISGIPEAVQSILRSLQARGIFARQIQVDYASHGPQMDDLRPRLEERLKGLQPRAAGIPLLSTVTGDFVAGPELDERYWARNLRERVQFGPAVQRLLHDGHEVFIEPSPHPILLPSVHENAAGSGNDRCLVIGSLQRGASGREALLASVGALYAQGHAIDWRRFHPAGGRRVSLPAYPWDHQRHWVPQRGRLRVGSTLGHPSLERRLDSPLFDGFVFEGTLEVGGADWSGSDTSEPRLVSSAAWVELVAAAARRHFGLQATLTLRDVELPNLLGVQAKDRVEVQVALSPLPDQERAAGFIVYGRVADDSVILDAWHVYAQGSVKASDAEAPPTDTASWMALEPLEAEDTRARDFELYPFLLDAAVESAAGTNGGSCKRVRRIEELRLRGGRVSAVAAFARSASGVDGSQRVDLLLRDADGRLECGADGIEVVSVSEAERSRAMHGVLRDWAYDIRWDELPDAERGADEKAGCWLIVGDDGGVATALAAELETRGEQCVRLSRGAQFEAIGSKHFRARLDHESDLKRVLHEGPFDAIVHLGSLGTPAGAHGDDVVAALERGCFSVATLIRSCLALGCTPRLWLVTQGSQSVFPGEGVAQVFQAPLWGFGRALAHEHPELWGGLIDLDVVSDACAAKWLADTLTARRGEDHLALRGGKSLAARLVRRAKPVRAPQALSLRPDATYLVTGGLGGLGLAVARWLGAHGARHLVLLGRSGAVSEEARTVLHELEARGLEIQVARADVADAGSLARVFADIDRDGPPLAGVMHLAGVLDDVPLAKQDASSFLRVFLPKALGGWNLHGCVERRDLDFFVMFSSLAGWVFYPGLSSYSYAAANAFLDALAAYRVGQGLPSLAIGWGPWAESGRLAQKGAQYQQFLETAGLRLISVTDGLTVLEALMQRDRGHTLVSPIDWGRYGEALSADPSPLFGGLIRDANHDRTVERSTLRARLEQAPPGERRALLMGELRRQVAAVIGRGDPSTIPVDQSFFDFGLDSLMLVQLRGALQRQLGERLPATIAITYPTVSALADGIAARLMISLDAGEGAGVEKGDLDDLTRLLESVRDLSDEVVRRIAGPIAGTVQECNRD